ncbi:MAG: hypothetical protein H6767_02085 [Candidatus Peribacteria bacterium]|nr:MAG: hypothetical protein H6767_02085 [Candidatus Peribacteria bacterium]
MSFRNERILYHRTCDLTGKPIISTYSPDKQFPVYGAESWWSDDWDPMKYGQSFDINQSFFKQFESLYTQVPKIAIFQKNSENSPYSHFEADQKNCYMTVGGHRSEDCRYMTYGIKSKDTQDVFWAFECENCYEIINSYTLQNCQYLEYSENCRDCRFGYYLKGCQNCIGCAHLTNKQYCIFNKQYSKEEYQEQLKTLGLENRKSIQYIKKEFEILK